MKDLKSSVHAGIKAAKMASQNISEINQVINDIAKQVEEVSDNKATLCIGDFSVPIKRNPMQAILSFAPEERETYKALGIYDVDRRNGIEIAKWSVGDLGYPCGVFFGNQKLYCATKEELENALSELLKQVNTGKAILAKMQ